MIPITVTNSAAFLAFVAGSLNENNKSAPDPAPTAMEI